MVHPLDKNVNMCIISSDLYTTMGDITMDEDLTKLTRDELITYAAAQRLLLNALAPLVRKEEKRVPADHDEKIK
ncbi:MAG: hypothetical protein KGI50_00985 [Patescibacteria group bacterium]|nr:hypothetical protein [Patescibacteria group bacterium]MDE2438074.1 hypothetical protein [Patescibacteria group bacterium]